MLRVLAQRVKSFVTKGWAFVSENLINSTRTIGGRGASPRTVNNTKEKGLTKLKERTIFAGPSQGTHRFRACEEGTARKRDKIEEEGQEPTETHPGGMW